MIYVRFHLYIQRMSRSMIKQQNSGATAHVVLYTPRQSTNKDTHFEKIVKANNY